MAGYDPVTLSSEGAGQSATGTAKDNAGNTGASADRLEHQHRPDGAVSLGDRGLQRSYIHSGSVPPADCDTEDQVGLSGVQTDASLGYERTGHDQRERRRLLHRHV